MKTVLSVLALLAMACTPASAQEQMPSNDECPLLDGAYVSQSILDGGSGSVVLFSQRYAGQGKADCKAKLEMTLTASVPTVSTTTIIPDGKFRQIFPGHKEAWMWSKGALVRYDKTNSKQPVKGVEIKLEKNSDSRGVLTYTAYVNPNNPNVFITYAVHGANSK